MNLPLRLVLAAAALLLPIQAQTPPPHPRLLFTAAEIPGLAARTTQPVTSAAWNAFATSVSWPLSSPSPSTQGSWNVQYAMRKLEELSLRYAILGSTSHGNAARTALLAAVSTLTPTGSAPYIQASYASVIAISYDLLHPLLSAQERTQVVNHLIAWVNALKSASNAVTTYQGYAAAVDNFAFSWMAGVAMSLMAIWGDTTSYPNLVPELQATLDKLRIGWMDAVSPDGSIDESYGYSSYGCLWAIHAAVAAQNCGLGDIVAGTNLERTGRWLLSSLFGSRLAWIGDSSPSHKGTRLDTITYWLARRSQDPEVLWGLEQFFALDPASNYTPSQAFSPYANVFLHYPAGLSPVAPALRSGFFRDNLNEGTPTSNKTTAYTGVGTGGQAFLHNSAAPGWTQLGALYLIRDEWMNHNHEDDGHLSIFSEGQDQVLDMGYSGQSGSWAGSQSSDHNIVVVDGAAAFNGAANNYYTPPSPNGRYLGRKEALLLGLGADYVRGAHENMWLMAEASRSVVLVKDPVRPYLVLLDRVNRNGAPASYDALFHGAGPAGGAGTPASPMTITSGGRTLRSVFLSPSGATVLPGSAATCPGSGVVHYRNRVRAQGTAVTFLSVHGKDAPLGVQPLLLPLAGTTGGTLVLPESTDKLLASTAGSAAQEIGDASTRTDARLLWLRTSGPQGLEFLLGEGRSLVHEGQTLASCSSPAVLSARGGRLEISVPDAALAGFGAVVRVPWAVASVTVNGQARVFTTSGNAVHVGTYPVLPPSLEDRLHSFHGGSPGDALLEGPALMLPGEAFGASSGTARLHLRGGAIRPARPFTLSATVAFLATGTPAAALVLRAPSGNGELFRATVQRVGPTTAAIQLAASGPPVTTVYLPLSTSGTLRFGLLADPLSGSVGILDALGAQAGSLPILLDPAGVRLTVDVTAAGTVDDVTYFDSDEDGMIPQGIVFAVCTPTGRVCIAYSCPGLVLHSDSGLYYDGLRLEPWFVDLWYQLAGVHEVFAGPALLPGQPIPLTLREVGLESTYRAVDGQPGTAVAASLTGALGQDLYGGTGL
jgi:hypothetical protein